MVCSLKPHLPTSFPCEQIPLLPIQVAQARNLEADLDFSSITYAADSPKHPRYRSHILCLTFSAVSAALQTTVPPPLDCHRAPAWSPRSHCALHCLFSMQQQVILKINTPVTPLLSPGDPTGSGPILFGHPPLGQPHWPRWLAFCSLHSWRPFRSRVRNETCSFICRKCPPCTLYVLPPLYGNKVPPVSLRSELPHCSLSFLPVPSPRQHLSQFIITHRLLRRLFIFCLSLDWKLLRIGVLCFIPDGQQLLALGWRGAGAD